MLTFLTWLKRSMSQQFIATSSEPDVRSNGRHCAPNPATYPVPVSSAGRQRDELLAYAAREAGMTVPEYRKYLDYVYNRLGKCDV